jgi:hypothetical protein
VKTAIKIIIAPINVVPPSIITLPKLESGLIQAYRSLKNRFWLKLNKNTWKGGTIID